MGRDTRQARGNRSARTRVRLSIEGLEDRQLLSTAFNERLVPSPLLRNFEHGFAPAYPPGHPIGNSAHVLNTLDNDGKVISGQTRDGTQYTLTLHGPGSIIVTDVTPNDGLLNDEIDTIQLVDTDLRRTVVTGSVKASDRVLSSGTVGFNRLIAADGVASVVLNGFVLKETGVQPTGVPRIALLGGVQTLSFHAIESFTAVGSEEPTDLIIGDPTSPLRVRPSIRINHIFNTAFDTSTGPVEGVPIVTPTVRILVNGSIHELELGSATAAPVPSPVNAEFSPVSYTGRTGVQALGIGGMRVAGSARNLTLSRTDRPLRSGFAGMNRLGHANFGGNADAVGIDVTEGPIGSLRFYRGLGNPIGTNPSLLYSGVPAGERGYPAAGLAGGVVAADSIGTATFGPGEIVRQIPPQLQLIQARGTGTINYRLRPGDALVNATVSSSESIGPVSVVGNLRNSRILSGHDYVAFVRGAEPVRAPSQIGRYQQRGDLVDAVVAASYRPGPDGIYGTPDDVAGPGRIFGNLDGSLYVSDESIYNPETPPTGPTRVRGAGFFARQLQGRLPNIGGGNPEGPKRLHGVLVRTS